MKRNDVNRRDFFKGALTAGAGMGMLSGVQQASAATDDGDAPALLDKVPRKQLGSTGATVPIILMGGSTTFDTKYDKRLHRAFKLGVDYIDTAEVYAQGQSQKTLSVFIEQVGRENVWVTSKAALFGSRATPKNYEEHLDSNLADLKTDYLNMFFMHMIRDEAMLEPEFIKMGDNLKKSGKTKFFGFSCHDGNVPELMNKAAKVGGIDAIMFRYNFRQYGDMELNKAIDACKKAGIGLIAMKTQASVPEDSEKVVAFQSKDFTLPQAKLKAVYADERIDAAVSGMDNVQHVTENTKAALTPQKLSMNEFVQLNRLAALTSAEYCNGCSHLCEAKIDGKLRVADAMRYLMYHESYGDPETARMLYNALEPMERDFDRVDLREAERACPQGIRIRERLDKARRLMLA